MRTIDADALYKKLNDIRKEEILLHGRMNNKYCCTLSTALYEIENAPTIEPEIVRCKDCANYDTDWTPETVPDRHYCFVMDGMMPKDGFCNYAERRTDE